VADLALKGPNGQTIQPVQETQAEPINTVDMYATSQPNDGILSDEDLAAQYRSQADALFKEAKALREQAESLAPTKKRTTQTSESA
jgi:hypothetical protein